jgi:ubiquinone biosynthesis protein UbiJ
MATQSPLLWLEGLIQNFHLLELQAPTWAVDEVQRRIVLLLNHILMQEQEACRRLARQKDRVVQLQWRKFSMKMVATPVGLLDLALSEAKPDLVLAISEESPALVVQGMLRGDRPAVRIEGDVQLAAEVNWLVDHVSWDLEEDLARVLGDALAHTIGQGGRAMVKALRQFMVAKVSTEHDKASR